MKTAAALYAGREKKGVHKIVLRNPAVLGVEITLRRPAPKPGERELPRIDIAHLEVASLDQGGEAVRLVFWEAKLFSNGDLRAQNLTLPGALGQIHDYQKVLDQRRSSVLDSYRQVAKNLVDIAAMRPTGPALDKLIKKIADEPQQLTMMSPPDVGLLVFEFDADQRDGKA